MDKFSLRSVQVFFVRVILVERRVEMDDLRLLTIQEVAKILGIREKTLWNWTYPRGDIPCVRAGRRRKYRRKDIEEWIEKKLIDKTEVPEEEELQVEEKPIENGITVDNKKLLAKERLVVEPAVTYKFASSNLQYAMGLAPCNTYGLLIEPRVFGEVYGVASNWEDGESPVYAYRGKLNISNKYPLKGKQWIKLQENAKHFRCNPYCALVEELQLAFDNGLLPYDFKTIIRCCDWAVFFETVGRRENQDE